MDIPEHILRDNIAHGDDSVLLSTFIHVTRQAFYSSDKFAEMLLLTFSKFDIRQAVPELQHEFCALWNPILLEARNQRCGRPVWLLQDIRQTYVEFHQGTEAAFTHIDLLLDPSSYPLCTLASHRSDSTPEGPQPLSAITAVDAISLSSEANPVHTAAQQAEETIITHSPIDLAIIRSDDTSPHIHPSASPTAEPVHIHMPPQVTSLPGSSILIRDLNPPVQIPVSHILPQSILPATDIDEPDNPTTDVYPPERREISHAVSASPQESNKQQDTCPATLSTTAYFEEISSTTNPNSQHIPSYGATLPLREDDEATVLCPINSDSASLPIVIPASESDVVPTEHHSSVESAPIRSDHTLRAPETQPSSSLATHSGVPSVSDAHVTTTIGAPRSNDDVSAHTPMEAFPHLSQSVPPAPDIVTSTLPSEDVQDG